MKLANISKNAKYIGYQCVVCQKKITEHERQMIISLGCFQTWCVLCIAQKHPSDKYLCDYITSNGDEDTILIRNKLLNGAI